MQGCKDRRDEEMKKLQSLGGEATHLAPTHADRYGHGKDLVVDIDLELLAGLQPERDLDLDEHRKGGFAPFAADGGQISVESDRSTATQLFSRRLFVLLPQSYHLPPPHLATPTWC